jgi:hypothetical protein
MSISHGSSRKGALSRGAPATGAAATEAAATEAAAMGETAPLQCCSNGSSSGSMVDRRTVRSPLTVFFCKYVYSRMINEYKDTAFC